MMDKLQAISNRLEAIVSQMEDFFPSLGSRGRRSIFISSCRRSISSRASRSSSWAISFKSGSLRSSWASSNRAWAAELGGVKTIEFIVEGEGAWSRLKYESGVHRVQRVPVTEASGRIQTSAATVAVLPEAEEVDSRWSVTRPWGKLYVRIRSDRSPDPTWLRRWAAIAAFCFSS